MWGKIRLNGYMEKAYKDGKIEIIFNAIDLKKYQFLSDVRENVVEN